MTMHGTDTTPFPFFPYIVINSLLIVNTNTSIHYYNHFRTEEDI